MHYARVLAREEDKNMELFESMKISVLSSCNSRILVACVSALVKSHVFNSDFGTDPPYRAENEKPSGKTCLFFS